MKIRITAWVVALLSLGVSAYVGEPGQSAQVGQAIPTIEQAMTACHVDNLRLKAGLAAAFHDWQTATVPRSLDTLVAVDGRIRALFDARPSYRPCDEDPKIFDAQWRQIGVDLYQIDLSYSGQLLADAHARNPNSTLRRYTLFSTVFGVSPSHGFGVMPVVSAAFAYATEFPGGPFARQTFRTIADFHKDLFMVLRDKHSDYKFKCFEKYIDADPWERQQERAKRVALDYYLRVLALTPGDETVKQFSDELARGVVKSWSFCAD